MGPRSWAAGRAGGHRPLFSRAGSVPGTGSAVHGQCGATRVTYRLPLPSPPGTRAGSSGGSRLWPPRARPQLPSQSCTTLRELSWPRRRELGCRVARWVGEWDEGVGAGPYGSWLPRPQEVGRGALGPCRALGGGALGRRCLLLLAPLSLSPLFLLRFPSFPPLLGYPLSPASALSRTPWPPCPLARPSHPPPLPRSQAALPAQQTVWNSLNALTLWLYWVAGWQFTG